MGILQAVASNSTTSSFSVNQPILTTPQEAKTASTEGSALFTPPQFILSNFKATPEKIRIQVALIDLDLGSLLSLVKMCMDGCTRLNRYLITLKSRETRGFIWWLYILKKGLYPNIHGKSEIKEISWSGKNLKVFSPCMEIWKWSITLTDSQRSSRSTAHLMNISKNS